LTSSSSSLPNSSSQISSSTSSTQVLSSSQNSSSSNSALGLPSSSSSSQIILSSVSSVSSTSSINPNLDSDNDGVPDSVESQAPNNGDGNNDTIKDYLQPNVVTTSIDPLCTAISRAFIVKENQNFVLDPGYEYPAGFINFEASCASSLGIKIYWYGLDTTKTYINKKYNSTSNNYKQLDNITQITEDINGQNVLTFQYLINDNDSLDEDSRSGFIKDPIGPALPIINNSGGIIIIGQTTNSPQNIVSNTNQNKLPQNTNSVVQNVLDTIVPIIQNQSEIEATPELQGLATVRTGGTRNYDYLIGIAMILIGACLILKVSKKELLLKK
jgi:hypothetical protein